MTKKRASKFGTNRVFTVPYTDLTNIAALTGDVLLFNLPQGAIVTDVLIKHTIPFVGVATLTAQVITAQQSYGSAFDVKQAVGAEVFSSVVTWFREKFNSTVPVNLHFVATTNNLNLLTAGSVDVIVSYQLRGVV